jgi:hypothetical protein
MSSVTSVRLSVRTYQRGSLWMDFSEIWHSVLMKICRETSNLVKIERKYRELCVEIWVTFILLKAVKYVLRLDNSAKSTHSRVSMIQHLAILYCWLLHVGQQQYKRKALLLSLAAMITRTRLIMNFIRTVHCLTCCQCTTFLKNALKNHILCWRRVLRFQAK